MNWLEKLRARLRRSLSKLLPDQSATELEPFVQMLRPAQDRKHGDYQLNCSMPLAKKMKLPPRDIAMKIVAEWDVADICSPPEIAGPGFINLRLRSESLAEAVRRLINDDRLGVEPVKQPRSIIIDFSSPNIAKPMHVGHLRSTVIGHALYRILKFLGHRVQSDNHIGDWGTQFGMILYGYKHLLDRSAYQRDPVGELARLYRLVNQLCEYHECREQLRICQRRAEELQHHLAGQKEQRTDLSSTSLDDLSQAWQECRAQLEQLRIKCQQFEQDPQFLVLAEQHPDIVHASRQETAKLHAGDEQNTQLWREFIPVCLEALQRIYERFQLTFDMILGESFYQPMLPKLVEELVQRQIAVESAGAICVFLPGRAAPFIIRKADGAFTYATTDLATIKHRADQLHADTMLYVVDNRQSEHFQLLFEVARKMGYEQVEYRHVSFGTVLGADRRPFKTRAGDVVGLESLLDEAVQQARRIVDENDEAKPRPELTPQQRAAVAEVVGIGGIIYADLRHNRESDYVFNWEKMLAKNGDTATYIQYAYARIRGIFSQGGIDPRSLRAQPPDIQLVTPQERELALQLTRFAEVVPDVAVDYRPNLLTQYLFETANCFASFYEECPVLRETDPAVKNSRLALCEVTARTLALGLDLLGIRVAEKM